MNMVEWEVFTPAMRGVIAAVLTMVVLALIVQIPLLML